MSATAAALAARLESTRARTHALLEPLAPEDLARPHSPLLSPPLWDLGHIAAYEELWLVRRLTGAESLHPELEDVYDAVETPRAARAEAAILDEAGTRRYLRDVRARALEALDRADLGDEADPLTARGFVFDMVAQHEAQHTETVLQCLQLMPAGGYRPPRRSPPQRSHGGGAGSWREVGGSFAMGAPAGGFAYDCERPAHQREVAPFLIARDPVTCGDQLAFVADGGYRRRELWTDEGWAWREREGIEAPLYWEPDGEGGWLRRAFERVEAVDPGAVLCHVSAHEADAHAAWAGARLPAEDEWELAAQGAPAGPADANLDQLAFGPAGLGAGAAPSGCRGLIGDAWEWTSSSFEGYPGFRAFPYAEYAEVFFGDRYRVLRGGSWATQPIAARVSFRNWDLPQRRQIFAGLRLARDLL